MEIHPAPEQRAQFFLDVEEREPRNLPGLELDQHIDVAFGTEILTQHGAEQGKVPDMTAAAEIPELFRVDGNPRRHAE